MQNSSGTGPHALPHNVSERETFCNNFYSTIFLQIFFFYSFLELNNYNGYVYAIYNYCFTAYLQPSQDKINFSPSKKRKKEKKKVRLIFFFLNHEKKNAKE